MQYVMVLNDGETFTNLEGCYIAAIPEGLQIEDIEETLDGIKLFDFPPTDRTEGYVAGTFDVSDGRPSFNGERLTSPNRFVR